MSYTAPIKDMQFVLHELAGLKQIQQLPGCEEATDETVQAVLEENGRFMAMKIGKPVFRTMASVQPDYLSSDCQLAAHHIEQGVQETERDALGGKTPQVAHPITLVRLAYGL